MKAQKFDEIVTARANQRAQTKINNFKSAINSALQNLLGYNQHSVQHPNSDRNGGYIVVPEETELFYSIRMYSPVRYL